MIANHQQTLLIMDALTTILKKGKFRLSDEKRCQEDLEQFFQSECITYAREHHLSDGKSIIDFYFPKSGIGIEVKVKGWGKMKVYRQCQRYCTNTELKGLILLTASPQGLPELIEGKPARTYFLGVNAL